MDENKKIRLYKFRPLANAKDFCRLKNILKNGTFWCSNFWDLNDPMEGIYTTPYYKIIANIYKSKKRTKICSFSGKEAFSNPLMWSHYANGFKGVAVEVEIEVGKKIEGGKVEKIEYTNSFPKIQQNDNSDKAATKILTTKSPVWEHEHEYRFLTPKEGNKHPIGEIKCLVFGAPFKGIENSQDVLSDSESLQNYYVFARQIKLVAKNINISREKDKEITFSRAIVKNEGITPEDKQDRIKEVADKMEARTHWVKVVKEEEKGDDL